MLCHVLGVLAEHAPLEGYVVWPSLERIVTRAQRSRVTVRRALKVLIALGYVEQLRAGSSHRSASYRIVVEKLTATAEPPCGQPATEHKFVRAARPNRGAQRAIFGRAARPEPSRTGKDTSQRTRARATFDLEAAIASWPERTPMEIALERAAQRRAQRDRRYG
jgi:hypothetical protein